LGQPDSPYIIMPAAFDAVHLPACDAQDDNVAPHELTTAFQGEIDKGSVVYGHALINSRSYGLIATTCSSYRVTASVREKATDPGSPRKDQLISRDAAMLLAVRHLTPPGDRAKAELTREQEIPIHWRVDDRPRTSAEFGHKNSPENNWCGQDTGMPLYHCVLVSGFVGDGALVAHFTGMHALTGAIVVIGSTRAASQDFVRSPFGMMPGALLHVNLGLELQAKSQSELPLWFQFDIDVVLTFFASLATIPIVWRPFFRSVANGTQTPAYRYLYRLLHEGSVLIALAVVLAAVFVGFARSG
jgi:hypothetical protein